MASNQSINSFYRSLRLDLRFQIDSELAIFKLFLPIFKLEQEQKSN